METIDSWLQNFCGEPFWNETVIWNTTDPKLTRCFRQTAFTILPCVYLWLLVPFEVLYVAKTSAKFSPWSFTNISRLVLVGLCILLNLVQTILVLTVYDADFFHSEFYAPFIRTATHFLLLILLFYHRTRGIVTSGVVWTFVLLNLLTSLPVGYSFILHDEGVESPEMIIHGLYTMLLVLLLISCSVADQSAETGPLFGQSIAESHRDVEECEPNPLHGASFPSKITYWWFNGLVYRGWRQALTLRDLWAISEYEKTANAVKRFQMTEATQDSRNYVPLVNEEGPSIGETTMGSGRAKKPGIVSTLTKLFGWSFASAALLLFFYSSLQFANPQLLKWLIAFIESRTDPIWHGVLIAILIVFVQSTLSVLSNAHYQRTALIGLQIRVCLTGAIYKKSLVLSNSSRKATTVGEISNLMSVDAERFNGLISNLNLLWSAPFEIGLSLYFLWLELGWASLAGVVVMVIMMPINGWVATLTEKMQTAQMEVKDERVKTMNEILTGMKVIKLYAWEESFMSLVSRLRSKEVKELKKIAYLGSISIFMWSCAPCLIALSTFAIYVLSDEKNILDTQKVFVSLALFELLRFPLMMLPNIFSDLVMVWVSVKRLDKFFDASELEEYVTKNEDSEAIRVENGSFVWEASLENSQNDLNVTVKNINLHVPKGSFLAIVGSVGTGKSSLLSALLGEMDKIQGKVNISGELEIAYVPQQAWVQNATLKDNILFGEAYDNKWYSKVIKACALEQDIEMLPSGDETEIGERGVNLSGGQKQRINLSRACYSDADLYLMDDPLSAVDAHVAKHLFEEVLSSRTGLLKTKTRVLVTNNISLLPDVDNIVVIKDGSIRETGSYRELIDKDGDFAQFVRTFSTQAAETRDPKSEILDRQLSIGSELSDCCEAYEEDELIQTETAETGQVKSSVYLQYFQAITWPWLGAIVMLMIGCQMASVGGNFWLSRWSTDEPLLVNGTMVQDKEKTVHRLIVYGGLGLCQAISTFASAFVTAKGTLDAAVKLHKNILARILRSPMSFFDTTPIGRIVNRFSKDINTVDIDIPQNLDGWLYCLLDVLTTLIVVSFATSYFLLAFLPISVVYYYIQRYYIPTSRQLRRLASITQSPIYSHFSETLSGVSTIRAYKANQRFINESDNKVDQNQVCSHSSIMANRWLSIRLDFCGNCLILCAALFAVFSRGTIDAGLAALAVTYALNVTLTLNYAVQMTSQLETEIVSVERILEYSSGPTEAEFEIEATRPSQNWPEHGEVQFENYGSRYRPDLDLAIKKITASVHPEEKVGIVGRTGAGKSTFTLALFRLIEAAEGKIVIDGIDISDLGLHDLRSKLTIIPQDPVLFSGTLRFNIDPFSSMSDEQLWKSLEQAHLKQYVESLELGLEHEIAESGENLSVGQKQLVCLTRALLRKTKILVLDEATAAIDLETDSLIQSTIRTEFSDCTVFTIAHRLNTILDSTRVMVLDNGEIVEFDNPQELLRKPSSVFYALAKDAGLV